MTGILQDSVEEWVHQASQMAEIFSNAYLTIAASAAENGHQGLMKRRRTTRKFDAVHNGKTYTVFVRDRISHEFQYQGKVPFTNRTSLPLRKRAWCFQEEILSKRIVHFTEDEIVFVCRMGTSCECRTGWTSRFQIPPFIGNSANHPIRVWGNIIEHYTGRQISYCKDRLPALSSLTQYLEKDSGRYLAGLWESQLPGSLLWSAQDGKRPAPGHGVESRPPSWSWAAIEGQVKLPSIAQYFLKQGIKILDVSTHPSTDDPRGMVSGGHITLRGPLLPLEGNWKTPTDTTEKDFDGGYVYNGRFQFACDPGWARDLPWSGSDACYGLIDYRVTPWSLPPGEIVDDPTHLLVIHNENFGRHFLHFTSRRCLPGLLLQRLDDLNASQSKTMENSESKLAFVRVGFGVMRLSVEDAEKALDRFGSTTVTIF